MTRRNLDISGVFETFQPSTSIRGRYTFAVDLGTTDELASEIPSDCLGISESGIRTREDVKRVEAEGIHCVLVGETLMRDGDPAGALRRLRG